MFVVSNDKMNIVNMDQTTNIYAGNGGYTVKINFANGNGCQLAQYGSPVAYDVIELIGRAMDTKNMQVFFIPDEDTMKAISAQKETRYHNIAGKKTKGHGGS